MKIEVVGKIEGEELIDKIRNVPLVKKNEDGSGIYPYLNANIEYREFFPNEVNPVTFYVLKKGIEFQKELREGMKLYAGVDSLNMQSAWEIKVDESDEIWTLTPPIVELTPRHVRYNPQDGEIKYADPVWINVPVLNDGGHRVFLANELGIRFTCLYISNAEKDCPVGCHPNSWSDVEVLDELPEKMEEKKMYTRKNYYELYRDYNILGCGGPRGVKK